MPGEATPTRAVLLDALGTLVTFADPAPALRTGLRERLGIRVPLAAARGAVRAEIAFYRANLHRGTDPAALAALRRECGAVVRAELGLAQAPLDAVVEALLAAIAFRPFPEVPAALGALRARGLRLAVVSNWDASLHEVLERCGLGGFDAVLSSAEERTAKPAPELLLRALDRLGVPPGAALMAGDSVEEDLGAARAAGVRGVLVDRTGRAPAPAGAPTVAGLDGLLPLVS